MGIIGQKNPQKTHLIPKFKLKDDHIYNIAISSRLEISNLSVGKR